MIDLKRIVIPAKAGIQGRYNYLKKMDSRLKISGMTDLKTFYEFVKIDL